MSRPVKPHPVEPDDVTPRSYDNASRVARSAATRTRVLDAARALLLDRGYRATTVAEIARTAAVNIDTVYALVGRKPLIVRTLVEMAISGTDQPVPAAEREYVQRIQAAVDPRQKLTIYAHAMSAIHARMAPLFLALRDASSTEPEAARIWSDISERRAGNMRAFAADLRAAGGLRDDLSDDDIGDSIWATNSPEVYVLLTRDRGWTPARYEQWLADTWCRQLLVSGPARAGRSR